MKQTPVLSLLLLTALGCTKPLHAQSLDCHVGVANNSTAWSYTVYNNEPANSTNYISSFDVLVNAPFTVTGTPDGWDYQTDGQSFVFWYNTDSGLPYPHDVAPGAILGGFDISSPITTTGQVEYDVQAWDHSADAPGSAASGTTLAPSVPMPAPEPGTWKSLVTLLLLTGLSMARRQGRDVLGRRIRCCWQK